jgi:hypothetical protein
MPHKDVPNVSVGNVSNKIKGDGNIMEYVHFLTIYPHLDL